MKIKETITIEYRPGNESVKGGYPYVEASHTNGKLTEICVYYDNSLALMMTGSSIADDARAIADLLHEAASENMS